MLSVTESVWFVAFGRLEGTCRSVSKGWEMGVRANSRNLAASAEGTSPSLARVSWQARVSAEGVGWTIVVIGVVLRLRQYLANRSLWYDEAMLAYSLTRRGFLELLEPLAFQQAAPPGYLWATKAIMWLAGDSEYAMRFVPLVAGSLSLIAFYPLAKRCVGVVSAAFATALFACSQELVFYSAEVKPYALDVLLTVVMLHLALRVMACDYRWRAWCALGLFGLLSLWFSFPIICVLGGVSIMLLVVSYRDVGPRGALAAVCWGGTWLVAFAVLYVLVFRRATEGQGFDVYWQRGFMPFPPASVEDLKWFFSAWHGFFELAFSGPTGIVGSQWTALAAALAILGTHRLSAEKPRVLGLVLLPVALVLVASALQKYPFHSRLILFTTPLSLLLIGAGAGLIFDALSKHGRANALYFVAAVILFPMITTLNILMIPFVRQETRPVLERLARHATSEQVVFVRTGALPAWYYYAERLGLDDQPYVEGNWFDDRGRLNPEHEARQVPREGEVWILNAHERTPQGNAAVESLLAHLDPSGKPVHTIRDVTAEAILIDFESVDGSEVDHQPGLGHYPFTSGSGGARLETRGQGR